MSFPSVFPPFFRLRSLKARVSVAALLIILVSLGSLTYFASRMLHEDMARVLSSQQFSTVTLMAAQIDDEVKLRLGALQRTAPAAAQALQRSRAGARAFIDARIDIQLFNGGLLLVDANGEVIANKGIAETRLDLASHNDAVTSTLKDGQPAISRPFPGKTPKTASFAISAPLIGADGETLGALVGITSTDGSNFLDRISKNQYGKTGTYMLIAPRHRLIVTSTGQRNDMNSTLPPGRNAAIDEFLAGFEGSRIHINPRGVEVLTSVKRVPSIDWMVVADLPTGEAFEPIRDMQHRMWLVTALLSLGAIVLIGAILRHQLSPLENAARILAAIPDERVPRQPLPIVRNDEIGQLIRRFNRVLTTLWQREAALIESEERFKVLHDASFGGIALHDHGVLIDCNQGMCDLTGFSKEELIGIDGFQLIAPEYRESVREAALSGQDYPIETIGLRKDGSRFPINLTGKNIAYKGRNIRVVEVRDISERKNAEDSLRQSEESFHHFFDENASVMLLTDPFSGEIVDANKSACRYYGYPKAELLRMNISAINMLPPDQIAEQRLRALNNECSTFYFVHRLASGELRDVEAHLSPIEDRGRPLLFSIMHDITERKQSEEKLQLAASVFSHAREAILITRADGTIIDVNDAFSRITGYTREEVVGRNPRMLDSGRQSREFFTALWEALRQKGHWYGEIWNRHKDGSIYATLQTISTVFDARHVPQHYVALFSDITALKEHAKQLEHVAHYDVLTTLPNRVLLADRMKQAMAQAERRKQLLAVAYLDLDGFKSINDRHGHETGDRLLIALGERMKGSLREGDTLARLGGDEFIAVLLDLGSAAASIPLLTRMLEAASMPIVIGELKVQVSASIGVTFYPQAEDVDADQLLRQADQAMYQAKLSGKNRYHLFDAEQDRHVRGRHESIEHVRRALEADEFVLYYQPKVNMRTGAVIGAEALIRWRHPERGLLSPAIFLPVVEEHPLAVDIGEWVIERALTQTEAWQRQGLDLPVSINVGGRQLLHGDFAQRLREALARHPSVAPSQIEVEVLETSALEDLARVSQIIEDCQQLGVSFALDDFGTGYSSLTYLKRLSVNQLKIDQSFVRDMLDDPDDLSILGGVLNMATAFRRQVLAEGVETVAHGTMLLQLGCELAQGYGIARPMPPGDIPGWIAGWRPDEAWSSMRPASRDDLPLLFAGVEHRAWVTAIEDYLDGQRSTLPLAHHQCRFSAWLEDEGRALHRDRPTFAVILDLHRELHRLASQLCADGPAQPAERVRPGLARIHSLRDSLLEALQTLVAESSTGDTPAV